MKKKANHRGEEEEEEETAATATVDGEKHDESERIGGIVSRRAHRPLQWNALTGSDARCKILRDRMDLEAAPSACDPTLSIRHAFLAACRTKRSRNWLHRDTRVPPLLAPSIILLRQLGFLPGSFARVSISFAPFNTSLLLALYIGYFGGAFCGEFLSFFFFFE